MRINEIINERETSSQAIGHKLSPVDSNILNKAGYKRYDGPWDDDDYTEWVRKVNSKDQSLRYKPDQGEFETRPHIIQARDTAAGRAGDWNAHLQGGGSVWKDKTLQDINTVDQPRHTVGPDDNYFVRHAYSKSADGTGDFRPGEKVGSTEYEQRKWGDKDTGGSSASYINRQRKDFGDDASKVDSEVDSDTREWEHKKERR